MKTSLALLLVGVIAISCAPPVASSPGPVESEIPTPDGISNLALPPVAYSLAGRDVNVFGTDSAFVAEAMNELAAKGAYAMESEDYQHALWLSGSSWVELFCAGDQSDTVILARNASYIERWPGMPTVQCDNGFVLPGFRTAEMPDIVLK